MRIHILSRFCMAIAVPVVMFPLVFWMQITLGHEVGVFPLYIFPVAKMSWEFGWKGAALSVVTATCLWLLASSISGQPFSYEWLRFYNALIRGVVFLFFALFILLFKRVIEQHRRRMEAMRSLLNVCHGCGSVQGSDGCWIPFEDLAKKQKSIQNCECPKCASATRSTKLEHGPRSS